MKRYLLLIVLFLAFNTSYAQLITLPWDINVCRGCRSQIPINPFSTVNDVKSTLTLALVQDGLDSPEIEIFPSSGNTSSNGSETLNGTYDMIIRSKGVVILVTSF